MMELERVDEWLMARPIGELDPTGRAELARELMDLVDEGERRIVIDLTDVDLFRADGLVSLDPIQRRILATDGEFHLTWTSARVGEVVLVADLHGAPVGV